MDIYNPIREQFSAKIQSADKSNNTLTCIIVSSQTNRGRRKVDVSGCSYDDYMKSPVVLAFHDDERIIARCLWLKFSDEGIIAKFQFRDSPLSNDIFSLYKEGFLTSWSIGFLPVSWNYEEEDGIEIIHITKWTLLEVSAVSIPMDANAITLAIGQGMVHDSYLIQSVKNSIDSYNLENILKSTQDLVKTIESVKADITQSLAESNKSISDIRSLFDDFKVRFNALENLIQSLEKLNPSDDSVSIIDFSDFSDEINRQMKTHINSIKGKI